MKINDILNEEFENPKEYDYFIGMKLSNESNEKLVNYLIENDISLDQQNNFHVTIFFSRGKEFPEESCKGKLSTPIILNKKDYKFEIFGTDEKCLVLLVKHSYLDKRHTEIKTKYNLEYDFPKYIPHITLTYKIGDTDYKRLDLADFDIELVEEYYSVSESGVY